MKKKKLLFIAPHLSTGGMPQYLYEYIKHFNGEYDIHVVEWDDVTGGVLVVSKNRIKSIVKDSNFHVLNKNKDGIKDIFKKVKPDIIHFQETPESFVPGHLLEWMYDVDRKYNIVITTHSSYTEPKSLTYLADKFVLVCEWSKQKFKSQLGDIPCEVWEYPSDIIEYDKDEAKKQLGFHPDYTHVLNVGLFTPNKNQGELIQIASTLQNENIKFHFVGNQAMNFEEYWKPLMETLPSNCIWHGERDDVDMFYKASDLFYFPSKLELNPLAIKEAISYGLPILLRKLDVYMNDIPNSEWLGTSITENKNILLKKLGLKTERPRIQILHLLTDTTHPREKKSMEYISALRDYGFDYVPVINEIYEGTPPKEFCARPNDIGEKWGHIGNGYGFITGRHYGCYLAHINALKRMDYSYDYTLFFEADADIQTSHQEFVDMVYNGIDIMNTDDVKYLSFSANISVYKQKVNELFTKTGFNQNCAHAYMIPNSKKEWWMDKIDNVRWDSADIWYNMVFNQYPANRYTTNKSYSEQINTGQSSLLDPRVNLDDSLVVVLAYPDNDFRRKLLMECISDIQSPVLISTHYPVPVEIQAKSDWVIYDKNNPLLYKEHYSKYGMSYRYWVLNDKKEKVYKEYEYDHSYAVYTLIQNSLLHAKTLGKEKVHIINYDYKIPNYILEKHEEYLEKSDIVFYKYPNDDIYSTGFFSGKTDVLLEYFGKYKTMDEYYSEPFELLERRVYLYYGMDSSTWWMSTTVLSFSDLIKQSETNREGVLEFSHGWETFEQIGKRHECDKVTHHTYHTIYPDYIDKYRNDKFNLFEIGVDKGKSFKLWCEYFPYAKIYGMDINSEYRDNRGKIYKGDQSDINTLKVISSEIGNARIIVDDGSHNPEHQVKTFNYLFNNLLENGGVYIIEDVETSYWDPSQTLYGYEIGHLNIVDHFTKLNHQVNDRYNNIGNPLGIHSITFASNCIIITKNV